MAAEIVNPRDCARLEYDFFNFSLPLLYYYDNIFKFLLRLYIEYVNKDML